MKPNTLYERANGHRRRFLGTYTDSWGKEHAVYEAVVPRRPVLGNDESFLPPQFRDQANGFIHVCEAQTFKNWLRKARPLVVLHTSTVTVARGSQAITVEVELQETALMNKDGSHIGIWVHGEAVDEYGNNVALTQWESVQATHLARTGYDETGRE